MGDGARRGLESVGVVRRQIAIDCVRRDGREHGAAVEERQAEIEVAAAYARDRCARGPDVVECKVGIAELIEIRDLKVYRRGRAVLSLIRGRQTKRRSRAEEIYSKCAACAGGDRAVGKVQSVRAGIEETRT